MACLLGAGHRPSPQFSLLVVLFKRANCSDIPGTLMLRGKFVSMTHFVKMSFVL